MNTLLSNWSFARFLRLAFALFAFAEAWRTGEWLFVVPGAMFAMQAFFNVGCCGANGCAPRAEAASERPASDKVVYEEVK